MRSPSELHSALKTQRLQWKHQFSPKSSAGKIQLCRTHGEAGAESLYMAVFKELFTGFERCWVTSPKKKKKAEPPAGRWLIRLPAAGLNWFTATAQDSNHVGKTEIYLQPPTVHKDIHEQLLFTVILSLILLQVTGRESFIWTDKSDKCSCWKSVWTKYEHLFNVSCVLLGTDGDDSSLAT